MKNILLGLLVLDVFGAITKARENYAGAKTVLVRDYNTTIKRFPTNLEAGNW